jgi:hypothetical protein
MPPAPNRCWFRFSLRTLFVVVAIAALAFFISGVLLVRTQGWKPKTSGYRYRSFIPANRPLEPLEFVYYWRTPTTRECAIRLAEIVAGAVGILTIAASIRKRLPDRRGIGPNPPS